MQYACDYVLSVRSVLTRPICLPSHLHNIPQPLLTLRPSWHQIPLPIAPVYASYTTQTPPQLLDPLPSSMLQF